MTDEVVLIPAILQSVLWLSGKRLKVHSRLVIVFFVLLNFLLLLILLAQFPPSTGIYFWSSLVWFGWYWYARSFEIRRQSTPNPLPAPVNA
jgi:ABC-type dipeptide/oligopeptide/nickel transport system permease subunit